MKYIQITTIIIQLIAMMALMFAWGQQSVIMGAL